MSTIPFSPKWRPGESTLAGHQRKMLDAIRIYIDEQGLAPSFRKIGSTTRFRSPPSIKHQLQVLEGRGFIRMNASKGRAIEVVVGSAPNTEKPSQASEEATGTSNVAEIYQFPAEAVAEPYDVPPAGRIVAGAPITTEQHVDDVICLPKRPTGSGTLFMLEVHGGPTMSAAIYDGDYVVAHEQNFAAGGDVVVALLGDEATVKTFRKESGHIWLMPHNLAYLSIDGTHATVTGEAVTVLHKLQPVRRQLISMHRIAPVVLQSRTAYETPASHRSFVAFRPYRK